MFAGKKNKSCDRVFTADYVLRQFSLALSSVHISHTSIHGDGRVSMPKDHHCLHIRDSQPEGKWNIYNLHNQKVSGFTNQPGFLVRANHGPWEVGGDMKLPSKIQAYGEEGGYLFSAKRRY